jgi:hypothetical protein
MIQQDKFLIAQLALEDYSIYKNVYEVMSCKFYDLTDSEWARLAKLVYTSSLDVELRSWLIHEIHRGRVELRLRNVSMHVRRFTR